MSRRRGEAYGDLDRPENKRKVARDIVNRIFLTVAVFSGGRTPSVRW